MSSAGSPKTRRTSENRSRAGSHATARGSGEAGTSTPPNTHQPCHISRTVLPNSTTCDGGIRRLAGSSTISDRSSVRLSPIRSPRWSTPSSPSNSPPAPLPRSGAVCRSTSVRSPRRRSPPPPSMTSGSAASQHVRRGTSWISARLWRRANSTLPASRRSRTTSLSAGCPRCPAWGSGRPRCSLSSPWSARTSSAGGILPSGGG